MLTLFSVPKPFRGHADVIQRNAIRSWRRLRPPVEVLVLGDDEGVAAAADEEGARHVAGVARNEHGTPLLDDAFARAQEAAANDLVAYVNADIILLGDFLDAVRRVPFRRFLLAGQRWDLDLSAPWDFGSRGWEERLRSLVRERATLHEPMGSDYFVFRRGTIGGMPPFAVGRPNWDNWFIYRARALRLPVIDATPSVTVVHQNHGYAHVAARAGALSEGAEGDRNRALVGGAGGWDRIYVLDDATHLLRPDRLEKALGDRQLGWRMERRHDRHARERVRNRVLRWVYAHRRSLPDPLWRRVIHAFA